MQEEVLKDQEEVFEPDFELTEEMEACACLCGMASGGGSGSTNQIK